MSRRLYKKIKEAPIGTELVYRGKRGVVTEEPEGAKWQCDDCLYYNGTCLLPLGDTFVSPCWDSEHCSGKTIVVRPILKML
jgi:hypothetical protein